MKAIWNGIVIAESDETVMVEGNHYFPLDSLDRSVVSETDHQTGCPWKGTASYFTLAVDGQTAENAAWYYPETKEAANHIRGRVAFWKGVEVSD